MIFFGFLSHFISTENKISSYIGILFSFGIIAFLLYGFIKSDYLQQENPFIVSQTKALNFAKELQFTKNNLISINVGDENSNKILDFTIFAIRLTFYRLITDEEGRKQVVNETIMGLHPCSENDMPYNDTSIFKKLNLMNSLCLDDKNIKIKGQFDEEELSYFIIELFICDNETMNNSCKSLEEINNYLKFKFFAIIFHDIFLDLNDFENPIKIKSHFEYYFIDPQLIKRYNIFLKQVTISTNVGTFFSDYRIDESFCFDNKEFDIVSREDPSYPLFQFLFYASKNIQEAQRRYQNLQELLGSLMGTANFIIIFFTAVVTLNNRKDFLNKVLNSLFLAEYKGKDKNSRKFKNHAKINDVKNLKGTFTKITKGIDSYADSSKSFQISPEESPKIRKKKNFITHFLESKFFNFFWPNNRKKIKTEIMKKKGILEISFFDYIKYLFSDILGFKKSVLYKKISKATEIYGKEIDVIRILKKIHEVDKLKKIILSDQQLFLFDSVSRL